MVQVRKTERERRTKTFLHLVLSDEMGLEKTLQVKKDIFDLKQEREINHLFRLLYFYYTSVK